MNFGIVLPGGTASQQFEQAIVAERSGWDGVFVWEAAYGVDAWVLLGRDRGPHDTSSLGHDAHALALEAPLEVASQAVTLDQISAGRAILAVGLGAIETELPSTGEVTDLRGRAERLDEGIDLIRALWAGQGSFHGRHYDYDSERADLVEVGRAVQDPIPIWVVGLWPRPRSMQRVLRCDGIVPQYQLAGRDKSPEDVRALRAWLAERGARPDIDVIAEGETPADDPAAAGALVAPWREAGCTWWLETRSGDASSLR